MAESTPNLDLSKPELSDEIDDTILALADNMDKIDAAFGEGGASPPVPDNFAAAYELRGGYGTVHFPNATATQEAGEPSFWAGGDPPRSSLWFKWFSPFNGRMQFDCFGSYYDPSPGSWFVQDPYGMDVVLEVFRGPPNEQGQMARNIIHNVSPPPTGGTWTITINGETTAPIPYSTTLTGLNPYIEALPGVAPGDFGIDGNDQSLGDGLGFGFNFQQNLENQPVTMSANGAGLTGPGAPYSITVETVWFGREPIMPEAALDNLVRVASCDDSWMGSSNAKFFIVPPGTSRTRSDPDGDEMTWTSTSDHDGGTFLIGVPSWLYGISYSTVWTPNPIPWDASAIAVKNELDSIGSLQQGNVVVTAHPINGSGPPWVYEIEFEGDYANQYVGNLSVNDGLITGPSAPYRFVVVQSFQGAADSDTMDWPDSLNSSVLVRVEDGATYYIRVSGYGEDEIGQVYLNWRPISTPPPAPTPVLFSMPGPVGEVTSGRWFPPGQVTYFNHMHCSLRVAGTTDTTITLLKNGAPIAGHTSMTLAASVTGFGISLPRSVYCEPNGIENLQVRVDAAGVSAEDLVVQLFWKDVR